MEQGKRNVWVGLFVLFGVAALATLIVLFGRKPTWLAAPGTYPLHVHFDQVVEIRAGNMVTVKGIEIGRVSSVDLVDPKDFEAGVDVLVSINNRYWIPEGSRAVATEPMLGQGRPPIRILPGSSEADPLVPGATIRGDVRKALDTLFPPGVVTTFETTARQIGDAAAALTPVLEEVQQILELRSPEDVDAMESLQGNLASAATRLDTLLKHFNDVLGDPQVHSQLRETLANVHEMSNRGKTVMEELEIAAGESRQLMTDGRELIGKMDTTVTNLDQRTAELSTAVIDTLDRADEFMGHLNVIGAQVSAGEGTVGRLVMDDRLYESLLISAERLADSAAELKTLLQQWRQEGKVRIGL